MSLDKWFSEKWVDISTTKNGKYPKCVPSSKASSMSKSEKKTATANKRKTNPSGGGKKPTYART